MLITSEIEHPHLSKTCVSICSPNAYEVFHDSNKYCTFDSHICSFTPMITYISSLTDKFRTEMNFVSFFGMNFLFFSFCYINNELPF